MDQLYTYENNSLDVYSRRSPNDSLTTSLKIVSDIDHEKIGNDFCLIPLTVRNPFSKMKYWIKQEIHDFEAMVRAIEGIDKLKKEKEKLISKIASARKEMQSLEEGKKTLKSLFQSQTGRHNRITELNTYISRSEVIVETYTKVINLLIIYMWMKEISQFKLWKASNYYKCLSTFCTDEMEGNHHIMNLWENLKHIMERKEKVWSECKAREQYENEEKLKLEHRSKHEQNDNVVKDENLSDDYEIIHSPDNSHDNKLFDYDPRGKDSFLQQDYNPEEKKEIINKASIAESQDSADRDDKELGKSSITVPVQDVSINDSEDLEYKVKQRNSMTEGIEAFSYA